MDAGRCCLSLWLAMVAVKFLPEASLRMDLFFPLCALQFFPSRARVYSLCSSLRAA
jgi:hypothetical protein